MNDDEPIVPVSIPDAPEHLGSREADKFIEVAAKLARMRVMTDADVDALAFYATNWVIWVDAAARVRESGHIMRSPNNFPIQNPYLAVMNKAQRECLSILTEFGLTPSSRTRVKAT